MGGGEGGREGETEKATGMSSANRLRNLKKTVRPPEGAFETIRNRTIRKDKQGLTRQRQVKETVQKRFCHAFDMF